jgi:hypothetical protein
LSGFLYFFIVIIEVKLFTGILLIMYKKEIITDIRPGNKIVNEQENRFSLISSFFAVSEKLASYRYLKLILVLLLPILILFMYPVDRFDYDMWWQMALGKYYLTHHNVVIDHSIFSWTPSDSGWIYNTFLGSIIIFMIYSFMGGFGLWIFQWLIFLGVFLSFYLFLRLLHQRLDITGLTIIAAIGIVCSVSCNYYKPELFTPLLMSWMVLIFICVKLTRRKYLFYIYPLMIALWVNLHGGFIFEAVFLVCIFIGEILNRILFPHESFTTNELIHLGIVCFLSMLAILLNPYGINYLVNIYNAATSESYTINSKYIQAYVSLWPYLKSIKHFDVSFFKMGQVALIMAVMMFTLLGLFLYEFIKKKSCDLSFLIITVLTYWASMRGARITYIFALVFFFTFFYLLYRLRLKNISAKLSILSLIIFSLFFANISYFTFNYGAGNKWFGSGLNDLVPVKEVAFLKKYRLEGPIFNDYITGGYLLWALYPDYKVFIDPRLVPFVKQVAPDYWDFVSKPATAADIRTFAQMYPFKTAIISYSELPLIFDFMNAGWRLLYFEKNAAILVHESLLANISPEIRLVDLGPTRFKDVKNPEVLMNVFSIYINLNIQASMVIYDIYKNNVSDCYKPKTEHLKVMEDDIRQKQLLDANQ